LPPIFFHDLSVGGMPEFVQRRLGMVGKGINGRGMKNEKQSGFIPLPFISLPYRRAIFLSEFFW
jgi:hypothetical protein